MNSPGPAARAPAQQEFQQLPRDQHPAMTADLHHVFSGVTGWRAEDREQHVIELLIASQMAPDPARRDGRADTAVFPRNTCSEISIAARPESQERDGPFTKRSRNRSNGVSHAGILEASGTRTKRRMRDETSNRVHLHRHAMNPWIGTSGFQYPEWKGGFYPAAISLAKMLPFYAERFASTEVNYLFRRTPSAKTIARWSTATPECFRFSLKAPQKITHFARLKDCAEKLAFFQRAVAPLGASSDRRFPAPARF